MKAPFVFCVLVCFSSCVAQQAGVRLYGYKQAVVSGVRTSNNTNNKSEMPAKSTKPYFNYFIYLTHQPTTELYPSEIWIDKTVFDVRTDTIKTTPVELIYADNPFQTEKEILVPATSAIVVRISLLEKTPGKTTNAKNSIVTSNELVLVYKKKGKLYTVALKNMKALRPALMQ